MLEREWDGVMAHDLHDVDGIRAAGQAPGLERAAQVVETKVLDLGPLTRGLEAGADVFVGPKNSSFGWISFRVRPIYQKSCIRNGPRSGVQVTCYSGTLQRRGDSSVELPETMCRHAGSAA